MKAEIWSDVVCPWCYIGKRNLEAALAVFEHGDEVDVMWRSLELDLGAPAVRDGDYAGRLASKYRVAVAEARDSLAGLTQETSSPTQGLRARSAAWGTGRAPWQLSGLGAV